MLFSHVDAFGFYESGDDHAEDGDKEAKADALEDGDAGGMAREAACEGDEEAVIGGDSKEDDDANKAHEGGGAELEIADGVVSGGDLLGEQGVKLGLDYGEHEAAEPDGDEAKDQLHFFHLGHRAESPWVSRFP